MSIRDLSTRHGPGSGASASDPELGSRAGESGDREPEASASSAAAEPGRRGDRADRGSTLALRIGAAVASGLLGFLLIAQLQGTEDLGDRLASEREEDLAAILSDLSAEADRLQTEITELRLTLIEFESSAERDELALRSLRRRLDDLRILAGVVATEGEGLTLTVSDPGRRVGPELLVDTVQELRAAGAEAIAVNGVRLVSSSWFAARNGRLVVDGQPLDAPYRIAVVGPAQTMAKALDIPGGVTDNLALQPEVEAVVEVLAQLEVPPRPEPVPFFFGEPLHPETANAEPG